MISIVKHSLLGVMTVKSLILDEGDLALVDTGYSAGCGGRILDAVKGMGRQPEEIKLCILTHKHFDHVGGLRRLKDLCRFKVASHKAEADEIKKATGVDVDVRLENGDNLPFAGGLRVIHTPGHTRGSISLLAGRALIVGDALRGDGGSLRPPSRRFSEEYGLAVQSLLRLAELDFDKVYVSHGRDIERDGKEQITRLVKSLEAGKGSQPDGFKNQ